jgi:transketolase
MSLAARDDRVLLLTGDLGFMVLEPFATRFPDRFFNVGVAEQNIVGLATGLSEAGFIPFVYSIATFITLRAYEFIRNGPVHHHLPVRFLGVGGGFEYGPAGMTHHALEDLAVMRAQPGVIVVAPSDAAQAQTAVEMTWNRPGPVYFRLGKNEEPSIPGLNGAFELGRVQVVQDGSDVAIVCVGPIAIEGIRAAEDLARSGISAAVVVLASISPPPTQDLRMILSRFRLTITVEAHYITGGIGSLLCEVAADAGLHTRIVRCGVHDNAIATSGSESWLLRAHGLCGAGIAETVRAVLT